jgi:hypothetical protein
VEKALYFPSEDGLLKTNDNIWVKEKIIPESTTAKYEHWNKYQDIIYEGVRTGKLDNLSSEVEDF